MKVYEPEENIELPELDILSFLFGRSIMSSQYCDTPLNLNRFRMVCQSQERHRTSCRSSKSSQQHHEIGSPHCLTTNCAHPSTQVWSWRIWAWQRCCGVHEFWKSLPASALLFRDQCWRYLLRCFDSLYGRRACETDPRLWCEAALVLEGIRKQDDSGRETVRHWSRPDSRH
jgi:hypothetical protein